MTHEQAKKEFNGEMGCSVGGKEGKERGRVSCKWFTYNILNRRLTGRWGQRGSYKNRGGRG